MLEQIIQFSHEQQGLKLGVRSAMHAAQIVFAFWIESNL